MTDQRKAVDAVDPQRMAALIDGRLEGAERDALLAQLDLDPETLEVYADAVAVVGELEEQDRQMAARDTPRHWLRRPRVWVAAIAAAACAVALPTLSRERSGPTIEVPSLVAGRLDPQMPSPGWLDSPWSARLGEADLLSTLARGARIGARIAQLELAARAGDSTVPRVAAQLAALLDEIPGGGVAASRFRVFDAPASVTAIALGEATRAAEQVAGERGVRTGAWLQAARIAAVRREAGFFAAPSTSAVIEGVATLPGAPPSTGQIANRLARAISAADWPAADLASTELLKLIAS